MSSLPPVSTGVVSTQLERVHNDRPAPEPPRQEPAPPPPPPTESNRGRSVDTST